MKNPITETSGGALFEGVIDLEKVRAAHKALAKESYVCEADGNAAAAYACAQMWRCLLFAGFPITPSTKWLEMISSLIGSGKCGIKKVKLLEAEHAVADYLAGAGAACRDLIFATATSSVGLDHMTECTRSLGASGLGNLLLVNVYRATANYPLCIEGDPSDTLAHRDDGWIQICCRGVQQIYDTILQAPCLGMHPEVLTPTMPGYYGIKDSHRSSRLVIEPDAKIHAFQDKWIAPSRLPGLINGDTAMGNCVTSKFFQGFKIDQKTRMEKVFDLLPQIGRDFQKTFGRPGLEFVEPIHWPEEDAPSERSEREGGQGRKTWSSGPRETAATAFKNLPLEGATKAPIIDLAIVGMGPDVGTASALVQKEETRLGLKIGVLSARLLTPFPHAEYTKKLRNAKAVLVVNQAHHYGTGHLSLDITEACYPLEKRPVIVPCFAGMGGATLSDETWEKMIEHAASAIGKTGERIPPVVVHEGKVLWQS
ncbi:MAG: hypothetical protein HY877_06155 [Deltaproteobacteria bacterium]|nr:hypothetical protein [Deltaproteobacteria bacterium]